MEKAPAKEVMDMDMMLENAVVMFSVIKELRKDTKDSWKQLDMPLEEVISANNATNVGLKKRDIQLS